MPTGDALDPEIVAAIAILSRAAARRVFGSFFAHNTPMPLATPRASAIALGAAVPVDTESIDAVIEAARDRWPDIRAWQVDDYADIATEAFVEEFRRLVEEWAGIVPTP